MRTTIIRVFVIKCERLMSQPADVSQPEFLCSLILWHDVLRHHITLIDFLFEANMHQFHPKPLAAMIPLACALIGASTLTHAAASVPEDVQATSLATVTVTGSSASDPLIPQARPASVGKSDVSVQDTPYAISVVDVEQAREMGAKNVQDALLYSAGVYAGRYGFDTRGDWAAVRGLGTATYQDGLRRLYGSYNTVRPEIYSLERIEVLKGPASVLYGQAELGGIVNTVTKRPQSTPSQEIEVQVGSHNRKQIAADLTGPIDDEGKWLYRLVALGRESDTQVNYVNDDARLFMPSITWRPSTDTNLTLQYTHQENKSKVSSQFLPQKGTLSAAPLGQIPSSRFAGEPNWDRYDTKLTQLSVFAEQTLATDWKLVANLRQSQSSSITREIYATVGAIPTDAGNITRTVHAADRKTDVLATDVRLEGKFTLGPTKHSVAFGIDHQNALWEEYNYVSGTLPGTFNLYNPVYTGFVNEAALTWTDRPDNKIVQTGTYLMDHMEWGPWILSGALRYDTNKNSILAVGSAPDSVVKNTATTGRVGLMYRFANGISPYVSYSEAFVPNLGTDGSGSGNYLEPTTGKQKEAGVKYLANAGNTSAAFARFDIQETNRIAQGATPGGVEQVGAATQGWETEVRHRIGAWELSANYMKIEAINESTNTRLSSIAEKSGSAWGQYHFAPGWRAGLGTRYVGNVTGANSLPVIPSVMLYDAMIGYNVGRWDFRFDIKNLADKEYVSWCRGQNSDCGYGDRLNAALTARYRI
jgi:iron complex outermembrane receptor protein